MWCCLLPEVIFVNEGRGKQSFFTKKKKKQDNFDKDFLRKAYNVCLS